MNSFPQVPPGFRFHPTDEELVDYYLRRKITCRRIELDVIKDVDLYKIEPWDLQELCRIGREEQNEWYFFSHKDKKYPTGTRTNRATTAGFWKATGRDKSIYSKQTELIGMRKTLVFYKGRAPNGLKSDWIMHEYRLETDENGTSQEEGWVVCKVFKKRIATTRKMNDYDDSNIWYEDHQLPFKDMDFQYGLNIPPNHHHFLHELPNLESPKILHPHDHTTLPSFGLGSSQEYILHQPLDHSMIILTNHEQSSSDQVTDWRVLDKFVASQLSQDTDDTFPATIEQSSPIDTKQETTYENASTSSSSCLWM